MAGNKTSISAGLIIGKILSEDVTVSSMATKVFPVVVDEAKLPYVVYRCAKTEVMPIKGLGAPDEAMIEVLCMAEDYGGSVELAEAVRNALDFRAAEIPGLRMRKSSFAGREELYENDAYIQALLFRVQIN